MGNTYSTANYLGIIWNNSFNQDKGPMFYGNYRSLTTRLSIKYIDIVTGLHFTMKCIPADSIDLSNL